MSIFEIFLLAIALGTDAFSVAMVVGIQQLTIFQIFRISGVICLFHIFMPLVGLYGGNLIKYFIRSYLFINKDLNYIFTLIGAGILMILGLIMIIENWLNREEDINSSCLYGWGMIVLAVSVSIDALSTGIGLGMMEVHISVVLIFGIIAGIMMGSGLFLGSKIGHWLGDEAQIIGGLALIYLGFHFAGVI